jgi:hypothetical protein
LHDSLHVFHEKQDGIRIAAPGAEGQDHAGPGVDLQVDLPTDVLMPRGVEFSEVVAV